jgi:hypothetical protein
MACRGGLRNSLTAGVALAAWLLLAQAARAGRPIEDFKKTIRPILSQYCYDCHADGVNKGKVALDQFNSDQDIANSRDLWWRVLKNVRAGIMPPQKKDRPNDSEKLQLADWIKCDAFGIDRNSPDPGRVTIRRLNRVEYRNTIRDLMGVDYNTTDEFPPDDTGYGFDTIGDVLSVSPMLLEKYMRAAEKIVADAVPTVPRMVAEAEVPGTRFHADSGSIKNGRISFYEKTIVSTHQRGKIDGDYRLILNVGVIGQFDFDPGTCTLVFKLDGHEKWRQDLKWQNRKQIQVEVDQKLQAGLHELAFEVVPTSPPEKKKGGVDVSITSVVVQGPLDERYWVPTKNFARFFSRESAPSDLAERRVYTRQVITSFARRAFRRPPEDRVIDKLVEIAEAGCSQPGKSFEDGIKQAMVAVLSSPRFLFRVEGVEQGHESEASAPIDEYALASRLSYFLWSTMPDQDLFDLAGRGELRKHLPSQVSRMLKDPRAQALISNFVGQWLELRDVEGINIDVRTVLRQDSQPLRNPTTQPAGSSIASSNPSASNTVRLFGRTSLQLDTQLRLALRQEPEMLFAEIVREDRSLAELIETDHTYLNEKLAALYKIEGVKGTEMRRVDLPKDSPRGGLLTMGAVLIVTSNPTRTSPVKRGQFILDNVLGMPAPPPPADVPALEASDKNAAQRLSFREVLQLHRSKPLCQSCHSRMDPLGLSLENFNAVGMWRDKERGLPIDASGQLLTGEAFHDAADVKTIIKERHLSDFYRCLAEKMLTYALGRGIEYSDTETVDRIVDRLQHEDGRFSALFNGIVESSAFQRRRNNAPPQSPVRTSEPQQGKLTLNQP